MKKSVFWVFLFLGPCVLASAAEPPADAAANPLIRFRDESDALLDRLGKPFNLSEDIKIRVDGEFRYRLEYRDDFNFNEGTFEDDGFSLFRTRLGVEVKYKERITFYAQGQDSESFVSCLAHKSPAFVNRLDLHQFYLHLKMPEDQIPLEIKVGRQELSYGDQRYVGAFGWSNVARVFDAVKVVWKPHEKLAFDAWFSQVVPVNRSQPDSADHGDNFYGLYNAIGPWKNQTLDSFLFIRHSRNNEFPSERPGIQGELKEYTMGNRLKGKWKDLDYGTEWAAQFGSRARDDIRAWSFHQEIGYTFSDLPAAPRLHFEYNHGSGDSDPRDGRYENFDNLFPTNHIHYGYMDFASLRNMNHWGFGVQLKPHERLKLAWAQHWFRLDTNSSAWFNAGQGVIRPASPGASPSVGTETDLTAAWKASNHVSLLLGYSHFHAGAFVKDTGTSDNANFFYTQVSLKL